MIRDDGVLFICNLSEISINGNMPKEVLTKIAKYWFHIDTIGINRQYLARGVNQQVDLLVSIPFDNKIVIGQYVVLGNDEQYHIDMVSHIEDTPTSRDSKDKNFLRRTQLTLSRVENYYDLAEN